MGASRGERTAKGGAVVLVEDAVNITADEGRLACWGEGAMMSGGVRNAGVKWRVVCA